MKNSLITATFTACAAVMALRGVAQQVSAVDALEQRFKQLDKNGDGKITTDELPQSPFFKQRDKNGDGVITLAEAKAVLEAGADSMPATAKAPAPAAKTSRGKPPTKSLRQGPQVIKAAEHGVGRLVADITFTDLTGSAHKLSSFSKQRAIVVALTSTSCPVSKKYLPTLANLANSYSQREVTWVLVNPVPTDKAADIQTAARSVEGHAIYVQDRDASLARAVGALTTTDVVVLDAARTVVYHGAVDDQYGIGYSLDAPRNNYLADALEALLLDKQPRTAATNAPGCTLDLGSTAPAEIADTYHNRVSRIMQMNCAECHRHGGAAPFSLTTFNDVTAHAGMIKQVVEQGTMPPWFASDDGEQEQQTASVWANDRSLSTGDKSSLLAWLDAGKPEGKKSDAPQPRSFADGWLIGKPDAVFEFPEPVAVKATGAMPYQNVIVKTDLNEDKWIQAIEIQPGDRSVVHHMMVYLLAPDKERTTVQEEAVDERLGFWAIYVPGNSTLIYSEGFAKPLPQGVKLRCQVHYITNGTATTDRSRIGVIFAKQPPQHEVRVVGIGNPRLSIPPGAERHREEGLLRLPFDMQVISFLPHMHMRGIACRYRVVGSNGDSRTLLDIPRYDFNWQLLYRYAQPQLLSRGDAIKFTAWYDNSSNNPANPDPTQTVRWGGQANDEMQLGYVEYFVPGLSPGQPLPVFSTQR